MKAIRKRNIQTGIATEENIESVSHDEIKQRNTLSNNYSLKYYIIIAIGVFVLIILIIFIMHWCRGSTKRPTKHDDSLDNKIANADNKIMDNASPSLSLTGTIVAVNLGVMIVCLMSVMWSLMFNVWQKKTKYGSLNTSKL